LKDSNEVISFESENIEFNIEGAKNTDSNFDFGGKVYYWIEWY
jgi:hypothetical protein